MLPFYLVKIIEKKYAKKLESGEVYMRSLSNFGDLKNRPKDCDNQFRGDVLEGIAKTFEYSDAPFSNEYTGFGRCGYIDILKYSEKLYCMYSLEYDKAKNNFLAPDPKLESFGDTAVIILDPDEFFYRFLKALCYRFGKDFSTSFSNVIYNVNLSKDDKYDEFCKSYDYLWQKEYRIVLDLAQGKFHPEILSDVTDFAKLTFPGKIVVDSNPDSLAKSITINIGDIRDISVSLPIEQFLRNDIMSSIPSEFFPPSKVPSLIMPHEPYPTFYKLLVDLKSAK